MSAASRSTAASCSRHGSVPGAVLVPERVEVGVVGVAELAAGRAQRGDRRRGEVAQRDDAPEPAAAQRGPGEPGVLEAPCRHHRRGDADRRGPLQRGRAGLHGLRREVVAQVHGLLLAVAGPVQGVQQARPPSAAHAHRDADHPVVPRRRPRAQRRQARRGARREACRERPGVGQAREERRVRRVPAQLPGAEPVDEEQAGRAHRRDPEPLRTAGHPERAHQRREHLGQRPLAVPGQDGLGRIGLRSVGGHPVSVSRSGDGRSNRAHW